ncbi:15163_t:CDS:2 [Funneliformis mosseae]|uniref:15163_t:CDS:1 n=1 Tax=Funneliformis mosseae TaxID=27381 RepID=A0A9N9EBY9_FUNMO|nr:15163_t:CDS:2 [Funneliformis mosseae]
MREKGKVKLTVKNNIDFEDNHLNNASSGEKLNNVSFISNAESEIDEYLAYNNNYSLIMKHLTTLEAENVCLQFLLDQGTFKMNNQQANNAKSNKRKPKILDESDNDILSNNSKILEQNERSKYVKTIVDDCESTRNSKKNVNEKPSDTTSSNLTIQSQTSTGSRSSRGQVQQTHQSIRNSKKNVNEKLLDTTSSNLTIQS